MEAIPMIPDILTIMMVGVSVLLAIDVGCYMWLRSAAGRFGQQPARVKHHVKASRRRTVRFSDR